MTVGEVRKLKSFLSDQEDMREIVEYQITETFLNHSCTYEVKNLSIHIEDGIIWLEDIYNKILNRSNCVAKGFLMTSSELTMYKGQFVVKLKDGTILTKVVK